MFLADEKTLMKEGKGKPELWEKLNYLSIEE